MALTKFTHVQDKLQAELDAVVGRERLPDYSDNDKLPYLICVVLETIRCVQLFEPTRLYD